MTEHEQSVQYINEYIARARAAQAEFEKMTQEQVDLAVKTIGKVVYENAEYLAKLAVEETRMGNVEDKIAKNKQKAGIVWNNLRGKKSRGILDTDEKTGITRVAKPVGVVAAITPCTNPIVTPMSNAMFALKCGNAIIITAHHRAVACSGKTIEMINDELRKLGYPEHLIQILDQHSREHTRNLISSADVVMVPAWSLPHTARAVPPWALARAMSSASLTRAMITKWLFPRSSPVVLMTTVSSALVSSPSFATKRTMMLF